MNVGSGLWYDSGMLEQVLLTLFYNSTWNVYTAVLKIILKKFFYDDILK